MKWFNEPSKWSADDKQLFVRSDPHTDFWRVTDYGYVRDNAHIYGEALNTDFDLAVRIEADYTEQYDQAGAAIRIDESHWIKTGVELFDGKLRYSTVVTIDNSNWMIANLPEVFKTLNLSLARRGDAIHISFSTDHNKLELASVVYLEPRALAFAGVMCASPEGEGFDVYFSEFELLNCAGEVGGQTL
jgi:regulation of enolase protein 1 (concanavalin A-like superfamily)